jgi:hypothetical protein
MFTSERQVRVELATAYRWMAQLGLGEPAHTDVCARVPAEPDEPMKQVTASRSALPCNTSGIATSRRFSTRAGSWRRARLLLDARTPDYPELRQ